MKHGSCTKYQNILCKGLRNLVNLQRTRDKDAHEYCWNSKTYPAGSRYAWHCTAPAHSELFFPCTKYRVDIAIVPTRHELLSTSSPFRSAKHACSDEFSAYLSAPNAVLSLGVDTGSATSSAVTALASSPFAGRSV